ncbi:MAG: lipid kinase [Pseudomonadota bacterium]
MGNDAVDITSRALLIINPRSRQGGTADIEAGLQKLLQAGIAVEKIAPNDAAQMEKEIAARRNTIDFVIVGGGDGTISSTAQSLYRHRLAFAILPLGTANDLARSLGIPNNLEGAFDLIVSGNRRWIDLGSVNGHHFFNACHIGLGVRITHELTPELKKKLGVLSYCKAFMSALSKSGQFAVELNVDGVVYRKHALELTVGNGRYYGGGNVVHEDATVDDGLLRLSCIYPESLWELLAMSRMIRKGQQKNAEKTFCISGHRITVKTTFSMEVHADGERATKTPAEFEIIPRALEVFAPDEQPSDVSLLEKVTRRVAG